MKLIQAEEVFEQVLAIVKKDYSITKEDGKFVFSHCYTGNHFDYYQVTFYYSEYSDSDFDKVDKELGVKIENDDALGIVNKFVSLGTIKNNENKKINMITFTEKSEKLYIEAEQKLIELVKKHGVESKYNNAKVLLVTDIHIQFDLDYDDILNEVSENCLIGEDGLQYGYPAISDEKFFKLVDHFASKEN